jgi:RNA recognition motif-containing protein
LNKYLGRGGYGFQRQNNNEEEIEILKEAIFIQNLPKNITRDDIQEAFSTVGPIKVC